eukprot:m.564856 g.564856  ORF g.564856 m.564856 type:complete len:75 (+) comp22236_c0_seq3:2966-3190(+)
MHLQLSQPKVRVVQNDKPIRDLMGMLKKNQKLDDRERKKLLQFKDLLEKMLVIDPSKRITPKDALVHEFIKEPY